MENNANRWMATIAILAFFGILAAAGTRSTARQTTQNVLVTNTSSQPVQIAARPGTGAYIVAVSNSPSVKVLNDADAHSATAFGNMTLPANSGAASQPISLPNTTPVIIDSVNFDGDASVSGESCDVVRLVVKDNLQNVVALYSFPLQPLADQKFESTYSAGHRMLIPTGDTVTFEALRQGTTAASSVYYTLSYHTVPM